MDPWLLWVLGIGSATLIVGGVAILVLAAVTHLRMAGEPTAVRSLTYGDLKNIQVPVTSDDPPVEAPKVSFALDGSGEHKVLLRDSKPQTVLWEAGIENPNPRNIDGVSVNMLIPEAIRVERVEQNGKSLSGGRWASTPERFDHEPPPGQHKDFWLDEGLTLPGSGHRVFYFKLRITEPGTYYMASELFGNVPRQRDYVELEVVESADADARGLIGEAIYEGEMLLNHRADVFTESWPSTDWGAWVLTSKMAIPDECEEVWERFRVRHGRQAGVDFQRAETQAILQALYECRRRIALQGP